MMTMNDLGYVDVYGMMPHLMHETRSRLMDDVCCLVSCPAQRQQHERCLDRCSLSSYENANSSLSSSQMLCYPRHLVLRKEVGMEHPSRSFHENVAYHPFLRVPVDGRDETLDNSQTVTLGAARDVGEVFQRCRDTDYSRRRHT